MQLGLQGEFGNEKGAKTAEQKNGERPVLILRVKVSHAVGGGPKGVKIKIGDSLVLPLGVKMSHAVGRGPNKAQNKNWRQSCAVSGLKFSRPGRRRILGPSVWNCDVRRTLWLSGGLDLADLRPQTITHWPPHLRVACVPMAPFGPRHPHTYSWE